MRVGIYLLICISTLPFSVFSQTGDLFLYSYHTPISNTDNQNLAAIQGPEGYMYFANTKGVITYNGVNWDIINTYSTPYALEKGEDGQIYVGCREHFGRIVRDKQGRLSYQKISDTQLGFGAISQIWASKIHVYFYSEEVIYDVDPENNSVQNIWFAPDKGEFSGMFLHQDQLYVNLPGKGLHKLINEKFLPIPAGDSLSDDLIVAAFPYDEDHTLLGTDANKLYLFGGRNLEDFEIEAQDYLEESFLTGGLDFSESKFVLSTLSGGCLIVEKESGKTLHRINYQTGLSDDEILTVCRDRQGGVWICNEDGISRADVELPIRNYSIYPGLEGDITAPFKSDSVLYVGTSEGVFYLAKVDRIEQLVKFIKKEKKEIRVLERNIQTTIQVAQDLSVPEVSNVLVSAKIEAALQNSEELSREEKKQLKKDLRKAKREERKEARQRKKAEKNGEIQPNPITPLNPEDNPRVVATPVDTISVQEKVLENPGKVYSDVRTFTEYVPSPTPESPQLSPEEIPYIYEKVQGIQTKCRQFFPFQDKLLVATNAGLYELQSLTEAIKVVDNEYIYFLSASQRFPDLVYAASDKGIIGIRSTPEGWNIKHFNQDISQSIYSIAETEAGLWLGGEEYIFFISLDSQGLPRSSEKIKLPNDYAETTVIRIIQGVPVLILSTGIYQINQVEKTIEPYKPLETYFNPRSPIVYQQAGYTWVSPDNQAWVNISQEPIQFDSLGFLLSFFENVESIFVDSQSAVWVVGDYTLYKIESGARLGLSPDFRAIIQSASNRRNLLSLDGLSLSNTQKALRIELASPYFLREGKTEFQYRLEGLDEEWSDWNAGAFIPFNSLPVGEYTLRVRARNVFGQQTPETVLNFEVKPAYWQTWWFYVLVLLSLCLLIYLLVRLRLRALTRANRRLENKVEEKTQEISKQNKQLEQAFDEISEQKNQIQQANQELKQINNTLEQKVNERTTSLRATLLQLLQTNKELDTFIYRASHDLRGPIARLVGLANLAKMEKEPEAILTNLNMIEFTAQRMNNMLEKLMNIHAINSEALDYDRIYLPEFLEGIKQRVKQIPESESAYLIARVHGEQFVTSDETLLTIIMENLLENSVIFRENTSDVFSIVKLACRVESSYLLITVTDNGMGIDPEHQERIFDMFYRGSELSQGNGLGLYLVKKATEKLHGEIDFKSEVGNVTEFNVRIPLERAYSEDVPELTEKVTV